MNKIGIIDYGMGNIGSILNSLKFINMKSDFITMPNQIKNYGTLILPGVGAFEKAMKNLENIRSIRPGFGIHPKMLNKLLGKNLTRI